ncbi:MAG: 50S ribosomal protein L27 [Minisyncoccia bacterium]
MATKKATGSAANLTDSNPKYLGVKKYAGEKVDTGQIIVRQRGTRILPGPNTMIGKDHTIHATKSGKVVFGSKRKGNFNGTNTRRPIVSVE